MKKKIFSLFCSTLTAASAAGTVAPATALLLAALPRDARAEDKPLPAPPPLGYDNPVVEGWANKEWSGAREDAVVEISESGLLPDNLQMSIRQGILFLYNNTKNSQIRFEIDFGKKAMVCYSSATPNLAFQGDGKLISTRPVLPGNFASTCFPTIGTYAFRVFGVEGHKSPLEGKITVMPRG